MMKHFIRLKVRNEKECDDNLFPETGMEEIEENNAIVKLLKLINTVG